MKIEDTKNYFFLFLIDLVCVNLNNTSKLTVVIPHAGCSHCLARLCSRIYQYNGQWQRWSRGHKARGQGQGHKKNPRPRPRTAFPRTDTLEAKNRNARGQGQGPRTQAQVLSKKKKVVTKIFQAISTKKRFPKNFSSTPQNFNNSKIVLSSSRKRVNFRGLESSRPRTSSRTPPLASGANLC